MINGTYVSGDACERALAFRLGYRSVCHHPREIGVLGPDEVLVIDLDHVLFDDRDLAIVRANEAANRGVPVGIHTYWVKRQMFVELAQQGLDGRRSRAGGEAWTGASACPRPA
jgi:hypothetical protein